MAEGYTMPYDEITEQAAIGCMLTEQDCAQRGCALLQEKHFYVPVYREIFQAMKRLVQQGEPVDIVGVWENLQENGKAERVGMEKLSAAVLSVSTTINLSGYIEYLGKLYYWRSAIEKGRKMMEAGYAKDSARLEQLEKEEAFFFPVEDMCAVPDIFGMALEKLQAQRESGRIFCGVETGFTKLDFLLGGLQEDGLYLLAARPAMGKTALALDIARGAAKNLKKEGKTVVIFSLEMSKEQLVTRIFSAESGIDNSVFSIRSGSEESWRRTLKKIEDAADQFERSTGDIYICDDPAQTVDHMRGKLHNAKGRGKKTGLVVIDYVQLISGGKGENRTQDISAISRGLKQMAREFHCPVLALSQLSREVERRPDRRPILSDLRDSGSLEQDADVVMFLYRDDYYNRDSEKKGVAELRIAKQRGGPTGCVALKWNASQTTFQNPETKAIQMGLYPSQEKSPWEV